MKKLIRNPELFLGAKRKGNYFEGWYFKVSDLFAIIVGMHQTQDKKGVFIQVMTAKQSYHVNFDMNDFSFNDEPFSIQVKDNYFSKEKMVLKLEGIIQANVFFTNHDVLHIKPNIMGPFSYVPFMQCHHAILSMKNMVNGEVFLQEKKYQLKNQCGYIEKDWGTSFPKSYLWIQGNCFLNPNASFMCAVADIPFALFHFKGVICVLKFDGKEYLFTTYNNTKIIQMKQDIVLKKQDYFLYIHPLYDATQSLFAPAQGDMKHIVKESITSQVQVILKKGEEILFDDMSSQVGLEVDGIL